MVDRCLPKLQAPRMCANGLVISLDHVPCLHTLEPVSYRHLRIDSANEESLGRQLKLAIFVWCMMEA